MKDLYKFNKLEEEKGKEDGNQNSKVTAEKHGVMEELGRVRCFWTQGTSRQEWQEMKADGDPRGNYEGPCPPQLGVEVRKV